MPDSLWLVGAGGAISIVTGFLQSMMSQRSDRLHSTRDLENEIAREGRAERREIHRRILTVALAAQVGDTDNKASTQVLFEADMALAERRRQQRLLELSAINQDIQITCSAPVRQAAQLLVNRLQASRATDHPTINDAFGRLLQAIRHEKHIND